MKIFGLVYAIILIVCAIIALTLMITGTIIGMDSLRIAGAIFFGVSFSGGAGVLAGIGLRED